MQGNCNWAGCLGRAILGLFFIVMSVLHFMHPEAGLLALTSHKLPFANVIFNVLIVINIILGLLLVIGRGARVSAWILVVLTIIALPIFLDFWSQTGPARAVMLVQFLNMVAVIGGLLLVTCTKKSCQTKCE